MARRNKRASMREGPLADLFRSTSRDDERAAEDETAQHSAPEPPTQDFGSTGQGEYETDVLGDEEYEQPGSDPGGAIFDIEEEEPAPTQLAEPPATRISEPAEHDPAALDPPLRDDVSVYRAEAETR